MSRIADTLVTYRILKLLSTPIKNSPAFQMGLVDGDGKQLRKANTQQEKEAYTCLLYTSPSPRDRQKSRMPSSA